MAWRMVKQPNGLYARWSDVVDMFTHMNLTRTEAFDVAAYGFTGVSHLTAAIEAKLKAADDELGWENEQNAPGFRWKECLRTLEILKQHQKWDRVQELNEAPEGAVTL